MGGALLKGWLASGIDHIAVVEPAPSAPLKRLTRTKGMALYRASDDIRRAKFAACVIALKPQILKTEAVRLAPVAQSGALMLSIAAGTRIALLRDAWGEKAQIVRAMPNTPGAIGKGITVLYAPSNVTPARRRQSEKLVAGLGQSLWVDREEDIDIVTAVSGSGPAYLFLFVEALKAAASAEGLPDTISERLARATLSGAGALLESDQRPVAELRRDVTSPGGTTEAALKVLMAGGGLEELVRRAVSAARKRANELSA